MDNEEHERNYFSKKSLFSGITNDRSQFVEPALALYRVVRSESFALALRRSASASPSIG